MRWRLRGSIIFGRNAHNPELSSTSQRCVQGFIRPAQQKLSPRRSVKNLVLAGHCGFSNTGVGAKPSTFREIIWAILLTKDLSSRRTIISTMPIMANMKRKGIHLELIRFLPYCFVGFSLSGRGTEPPTRICPFECPFFDETQKITVGLTIRHERIIQ